MEKNYDFRGRLLQVHKPDRRDDNISPVSGEVLVDSGWSILRPQGGIVLQNAASDLADYFAVSMHETLRLSDTADGKTISYQIDAALPENRYGIRVSENAVALCGRDERSAAQAGYFLEDLMNLKEAPIVKIGENFRTPLYVPRMVHSGYDLDVFPDEYLASVAHAGISSILLFVKDVNVSLGGPCDFNDIITRAGNFGLDVYAYSMLKSRLHPSDEGADAFYDDLYGRLFRECPGFKGVVFVGESCEFPSKDERTTGRLRLDNIDKDGKKIIKDKPNPGWFPCRDYPEWLAMVKGKIRAQKPDADVVLWSYNWGYCDEKDRIALIDALPTDISLLVTFEMFENMERNGVTCRTTDYTLFFEGPGKYFTSEAIAAKRRGIRLYTMANCGGLTWDVGTIPYEPAPYQWMKRYRAMRQFHKDCSLCGTMDSHHFGFTPSFISDLAKWAFCEEEYDLEQVLFDLVKRDFSQAAAPRVLDAYRLFSTGIENLISTNTDQYGAFRVGPSYPFLLFAEKQSPIPCKPTAHYKTICDTNYHVRFNIAFPNGLASEADRKKFNFQIASYRKVRDCFNQGADILDALVKDIPARKQQDALRLINMCRFVARTAQTTVNFKEWFQRKLQLQDAAEKDPIKREMLEIAAAEIENVKATLPLVAFDSRLGYEPSMDYMCDESCLEWKLEKMNQVIEELKAY